MIDMTTVNNVQQPENVENTKPAYTRRLIESKDFPVVTLNHYSSLM